MTEAEPISFSAGIAAARVAPAQATVASTSVPHAVAKAALAHQVGSAVERSYARSDLFDKRRDLMDGWAEYVTK